MLSEISFKKKEEMLQNNTLWWWSNVANLMSLCLDNISVHIQYGEGCISQFEFDEGMRFIHSSLMRGWDSFIRVWWGDEIHSF